MSKKATKDSLRKEIGHQKEKYTPLHLLSMSEEVFSVLEILGEFQEAKHIFIYNGMQDEVSTKTFVDRWKLEKNFYLPVVVGNELVFRAYNEQTKFETSNYGIEEPQGADFTDFNIVDLVIVPGLAFDRKMNRLGRGKGFYDRFLPNLKARKVGVCFDFQLLDSLPHENEDVKMDIIVSENELIW